MKTHSTLSFWVGLGLIASSISSCAPTVSTLQLEPVSGDVATIDGRAVTKVERNGVGVVASFEREDMEFITLDVEVKNRTNDTLNVNPADFRFVALGAQQDTLSDPRNTAATLAGAAADPSYEAGRIQLKQKQEVKRLKRAKVFNTVLMVAAIASDVSSSSKSRSYNEYIGNRVAHHFAYQGIAAKRAIDHSTFADRMQRYEYEEYRWGTIALKANSLAPGESVRGFVYLPKVQAARYLAISYSVPEQAPVPLLFKQELVQEKRKRRR